MRHCVEIDLLTTERSELEQAVDAILRLGWEEHGERRAGRRYVFYEDFDSDGAFAAALQELRYLVGEEHAVEVACEPAAQ